MTKPKLTDMDVINGLAAGDLVLEQGASKGSVKPSVTATEGNHPEMTDADVVNGSGFLARLEQRRAERGTGPEKN